MRLLAILAAAIMITGCSGHPGTDRAADGDGGSDAAVDDAADGTGHDGGDFRPVDVDLGEDFGVLVPDGAAACPLGMGRSLEDMLREKVRISFTPGLLVLPRDSDSFEAELIRQVELTPGAGTPVAAGNGRFTRTVIGSLQDGTVEYIFTQDFSVDARVLQVAVTFRFEVAGGVAIEPLVVLDPQGMLGLLSADQGWLAAGLIGGEAASLFLSCDAGPWRRNRYDFDLSNGDSLVLEEWMVEVPGWMLMCAAGLERATWTRGGVARVVDGYWDLAYAPGNHNILEYFAFRLDPPEGDVCGIKVYTQSLGMPLRDLSSIYTLDADLAQSGRLDIADAAYQGVQCFMGD